MFTGLIEDAGLVAAVDQVPAGLTLAIDTALARDLTPGDSLAINGVCLTVTVLDGTRVRMDVGPETARVTTLGTLRPADRVNLERSMRADGRLGGHFVQGHVDATGTIDDIRVEGEAHWVTIGYPPDLATLLVQKGSVTVDGISLTIADLRDDRFDVMIIPYTWQHTNLSARRVGDRVNLECDIIGKYVARAFALRPLQVKGERGKDKGQVKGREG